MSESTRPKPQLSLIDQSFRWEVAEVRARIADLTRELSGEAIRRERWCSFLVEFQTIASRRLLPLIEKSEALSRSIQSMVTKFLEGQRFSFDERAAIRFWHESLAMFGIVTDSEFIAAIPYEESSKIAISTFGDRQGDIFLSARSTFERLSTAIMISMDEFLSALESKEVKANEPHIQSPEKISEVEYYELIEARDDLEDNFFFARFPFAWNDSGLGLQFLAARESGESLELLTSRYEKSLFETIQTREEELEKLRKVDAGALTPHELIETPDEIDNDDDDFENDPELQELMEQFTDKLSEALELSDQESQERGARKRRLRDSRQSKQKPC